MKENVFKMLLLKCIGMQDVQNNFFNSNNFIIFLCRFWGNL